MKNLVFMFLLLIRYILAIPYMDILVQEHNAKERERNFLHAHFLKPEVRSNLQSRGRQNRKFFIG